MRIEVAEKCGPSRWTRRTGNGAAEHRGECADAMPQGGTFTIDVRNAPRRAATLTQRARSDRTARHRCRHSARRHRQGVRSVLHHQGTRRGHRSRASARSMALRTSPVVRSAWTACPAAARPSRFGCRARHTPLPNVSDDDDASRGIRAAEPSCWSRTMPRSRKSRPRCSAIWAFRSKSSIVRVSALERLDRDARRYRPVADRCVMPDGLQRRRSRHPDPRAVHPAADHPDLRLQRRGCVRGAVFPMLRKPVPYDDLYRAISSRLEHLRRVIA